VVGVEIIAQEDDKGLKLLGMFFTTRTHHSSVSTRVCASCRLQSAAFSSPLLLMSFYWLGTVSDASPGTHMTCCSMNST
jgi:hypothetical protein